jgi:dolichol-phosphate mannosyltransferase
MRFDRLVKFGIVGGIGVIINTITLYLLSRWLSLPLALSAGIAVELAIVSNFFWNNRWTFAYRNSSLIRFAKFNAASLVGLIFNVTTVWGLTRAGLYFLMANLVGIGLGMVVNYAGSVAWVWRRA